MAFKTKPNVEKALSQFMEIATAEVFHMRLHVSCTLQNMILIRDSHPSPCLALYGNFGQLTHNLVPTDVKFYL